MCGNENPLRKRKRHVTNTASHSIKFRQAIFYAFIIQFKLQTIQRMKSPLLILSSPKICKILLRMVIFGKICGSFLTLFFVHCFTPFFAHMQDFLWVPDHSNFFNRAKFKQTCIGLDFFTRCSCFAIIIQL